VNSPGGNGSEGSKACIPHERSTPVRLPRETFFRFLLLENGHVAAHLVFEGSTTDRIAAAPDVYGDGRSEIAIESGYVYMGVVAAFISLIGFTERGVKTFGAWQAYDDICVLCRECGRPRNPPCEGSPCQEAAGKSRAYAWFVRAGSRPVFYQQTFTENGRKNALTQESG